MIIKRVVLRCDQNRAFALFTEHAGEWWPAERRHTGDPASAIRIEASGRFYERANNGTDFELGVVRVFAPPSRLELDWYPGTGKEHPTRVQVVFEPHDGGTCVTVTHDPGVAGTDEFERSAPKYDQSWDLVLAALSTKT